MTDQLDLFHDSGREPNAVEKAGRQSRLDGVGTVDAAAAPSRPEHSCDRCGSTDDVMYGLCVACFARGQEAA